MTSVRCIRSLKASVPLPTAACSSHQIRALHSSSQRQHREPEQRPYDELEPTTSARIRHRVQGNNRLPSYERTNRYSLAPPETHFMRHLHGLFPGLEFPRELAQRMLTHASHPSAVRGHNGSLVFLGRRVLESYLLLFLTSSSALNSTMDLSYISERAINTYTLGQHTGSQWGLGRVMAWTPTLPREQLRSDQDQRELLQSIGLYKVQGDAVFAVMGGIFFQFGASVALRAFHTRLLPHLLTPAVPAVFHNDAHRILREMGGREGPLLTPFTSEQQKPEPKRIESTSDSLEEDAQWVRTVGVDMPLSGLRALPRREVQREKSLLMA